MSSSTGVATPPSLDLGHCPPTSLCLLSTSLSRARSLYLSIVYLSLSLSLSLHLHIAQLRLSASVRCVRSNISPSQVALWKGASGSHLTAHVDLVRFERWLNPSSERPLHHMRISQAALDMKRAHERQQRQKNVSRSTNAKAPHEQQAKKSNRLLNSERPPPYRGVSAAKLATLRHVNRETQKMDDIRRVVMRAIMRPASPLADSLTAPPSLIASRAAMWRYDTATPLVLQPPPLPERASPHRGIPRTPRSPRPSAPHAAYALPSSKTSSLSARPTTVTSVVHAATPMPRPFPPSLFTPLLLAPLLQEEKWASEWGRRSDLRWPLSPNPLHPLSKADACMQYHRRQSWQSKSPPSSPQPPSPRASISRHASPRSRRQKSHSLPGPGPSHFIDETAIDLDVLVSPSLRASSAVSSDVRTMSVHEAEGKARSIAAMLAL